MITRITKEEGRKRIIELVERFKHNEADHLRLTYNETQTRTEFITPFLEAFGWDVHNNAGLPLPFREVIEEATVEVGEEKLSKKPDYELRLARQRKLFIEAKKPSVHIDRERAPAFQTRRYGYSASLPISVATNFRLLAIYDCLPIPAETDEAHVARVSLICYEAYEDRFDELWDLLSREAVYSGTFDRHFEVDTTRHGAEQFDDYFLKQVRGWREQLAIDIHMNTPGLSAEELTIAVQLFLSRIVFLRICEDREIEKYETLKNLDTSSAFNDLNVILRRADKFYNSGLFALLDDERLGICISDATLASIIQELYYPQSPYTFAVVETQVLGEIYEQFLGEVIAINEGKIEIVSKPEVRESGGVVPTPSFIADRIVEKTLGPLISGKSPEELVGFTVADICCGSGIFLLSAYEYLLSHYLSWYINDDPVKYAGHQIYEAGANIWRVTFEEKRRILLEHLRGVDIDAGAVEIAQFSLFLKLLEDESKTALNEFIEAHRQPALPNLVKTIRWGNSLVSTAEWQAACGTMKPYLRYKVIPFSWPDEFPDVMNSGGFNVIVGNPPYIRIQNMVTHSHEEINFYQNTKSPYSTAQHDNFDKYALFIERSLNLVQSNGRIGVIVPHKFMSIQSGRALRRLLTEVNIVEDIVHFGVKQVFGQNTSNYTSILVLNCAGSQSVRLEKAGPLEAWRYGQEGSVTHIPTKEFTDDPWQFADDEVRALFAHIRSQFPVTLAEVADIGVGVQTSADAVYIISETTSDPNTITCRWNGSDWRIERDILRPCLHDIPVFPYTHPEANAWMIFPYNLNTNSNGKIRAHLIQPDEMASNYPGCWAYLNARRDDLEDRNIVGGSATERQWYQYGRSQSLTKFGIPKIIFPVLSFEARYSYDEINTMFTGGGNGPYYMVSAKEDTRLSTVYLLAILNHPLSEAFVRTNTSAFRGGYYSHGKQFIKNLPIPIPTDEQLSMVQTKVTELISAIDELSAARTQRARLRKEREVKDFRQDIESYVSILFGLSDADLKTIDSVPIPS